MVKKRTIYDFTLDKMRVMGIMKELKAEAPASHPPRS